MTLEDLNIGIVVQLKNLKTTEKEVETFTEKVKETTDSISDDKATKSLQTWNINFKKLRKNIGTFIGSLMTVRGIWFALRKSMTMYLNQNEELQNKLNGLYYGVGSAFAPMLETLVNGLIRLVAYADVFAKAMGLAGINMANYNKSATAARKTLLGIDEINNLTTSSSSSSATDPFKDVVLADSWVIKALEKLGSALKGIFDISFVAKIANGESLTMEDWKNVVVTGLGLTALGYGVSVFTNGNGLGIAIVGVATLTWGLYNIVKNASKKFTLEDWKKVIIAGLGLTALGTVIALTATAGLGLSIALAGVLTITWAIKNIIGSEDKGTLKSTGATSSIDITNYKKRGVIASYDVGTNYVPNDQLAMVHEGEAIVPKKFNSNAFFGETSAEELTLLASIEDQLERLNSKDYTINLDGENVARKVDQTIQKIKQRTGTNVFEVAR